jgi:transcriptional regulator with GAF, ATPase, and Fis domain
MKNPIFRWFLRVTNSILINGEGGPKQIVRSLRQITAALDAGEAICLFPEGALSRGSGVMLPFRRGFERVLTAALTNRLHEVSLLLDAGKQMNAHLQMDELLDTILRSACELLDATGGSVMLVEETDLVTVCALGRDAAVGQRMRLGDGVAGYVAIRRDPVLIDGHADPDLFPGLVLREPYVESAMSVPLVHRAELQGVLNVNAPIGRSFTEYDLRALAVFAEQAALAIANARLYEAERAHVAALLDLRRKREAG